MHSGSSTETRTLSLALFRKEILIIKQVPLHPHVRPRHLTTFYDGRQRSHNVGKLSENI